MQEKSSYQPPYDAVPSATGRSVAVAIKQDGAEHEGKPKLVASGRGKIAEQIVAMALEKGVKVRQDADLAELLSTLDLDTPIPAEAIIVVAEILARVYQLNASMDLASQRPTAFNAQPSPDGA